MDALFQLVRMPLVPIPLVLWTLLWPILLTGIVVVAIPIRLIATNAMLAIGFPFVFLRAAFTNEPARLTNYRLEWASEITNAVAMAGEVKVAAGYERIFSWLRNPQDPPGAGWLMGVANVVGLALIGSIVSELVRAAVGLALAAIILLIILGLAT